MSHIRRRVVLGVASAVCAVGALLPISASAAWEPTEAGRIRRSRRNRRRRRSDGAVHPGRRRQAQSDEAAAHRRQQVGRRGRRRLPRRQGGKGRPHKIIITLSNLFTTPLATGVPFNWKDLTPVAMLALDEFVLWVNADAPYKTAQDYIAAIKRPARTSSRWPAPARSRKTRSSPSRSRRRPARR